MSMYRWMSPPPPPSAPPAATSSPRPPLPTSPALEEALHGTSTQPSQAHAPEPVYLPRAPAKFKLVQRKQRLAHESAHRAHHYSPEEQSKLASFQSISYLPLHTKIYREWLKTHWTTSVWENWTMMAIIGVATGLAGALLKNCIQFFTHLKFTHVQDLIQDDRFGLMWFYVMSVSLLLAFGAAAVVVYFEPAAAGSGVPEVMAYLNGVSVPKVFNARTLLAKYISVALAVSSGLYVGNEGPMIHIGSSIGKVLSQGAALRNGKCLTLFKRFRNMYDRRNFISAGAAAGVASAFGAPVGGLLFVLEEISSFWSHRLAWETFFCCMLSTITTELITNSFEAFRWKGQFGLFTNNGSYVFYVDVAMKSQLYMFFPTVLLGMVGGLAGAGYTFLNLKFAKFRNRWIARIPWRRVAEVVAVAVLTATLSILLPAAFSCKPTTCATNPAQHGCTSRLVQSGLEHTEALHRYTCPEGYYNPAATLMFTSGEKTIEHLLSRNTHYEVDYGAVITLLLFYFLISSYSTGMANAAGIMVPSLLIGGTIGRLFGLIVTDIAGGVPTSEDLSWVDPGVFALIGCAAFFAGVTRLTMSLTVIMIEITNDTHFLLPVMTAVVVAKLTADSIMTSLYHNLIELKCLPYLPDDLHSHSPTCMELHTVREVMSQPAVTLPLFGSVAEMARKLITSTHNAFPVVEKGAEGFVFKGMILRNHITCILAREELFSDIGPREGVSAAGGGGMGSLSLTGSSSDDINRQTSFRIDSTNRDRYGVLGPEELANLDDKLPKFQMSSTDTGDRDALIARLATAEYETKFVNISPYLDQSSYMVPDTFSLERGYNLFRTMGLRHIVVVDKHNNVCGVLSRKDLLSLNVEHRLERMQQEANEAVTRKRTMTLELLERSRSNSLGGGVSQANSPPTWHSPKTARGMPPPPSPILLGVTTP